MQPDPMRGRPEFVRVTSVDVLGHYRLALGFCDGSKRDVDLTRELHGPVFGPLADPGYFAQAQVDDQLGSVVWPNGPTSIPLVWHGDFEPASRGSVRLTVDLAWPV
jgi:hypothetical protein